MATKATIKQVREFFEADGGRKVQTTELLEFKKADPTGFEQVAVGIGDGSLNY